MSEVRYGIVGAGYFGTALARGVAALPGAAVARLYDPVAPVRLAAEVGAQVADSIADACRDVDAVIVASPNGEHLEPVQAAAASGADVFCEKPIALSYADCARMLQTTRDAGVLFLAGHVMQFMDGVRRTKRLIADGAIGDLLFARAVRTGWEAPQPQVSWKKVRELSGGHLYHHIHELDLVRSIMGTPQRVSMTGGNVAHHGDGFGDEDDLLLLSLDYDGSRFATLEYGSAFRWPEHHVLVEGSEGAIRIDLQDAGVTLRRPGGDEHFLLHRSAAEDAARVSEYRDVSGTGGGVVYGHPGDEPPQWLRGIIDAELEYFHGLVRGAAPAPEFASLTDGSAAAATIATADALTLSLAEKRWVRVDEITGA